MVRLSESASQLYLKRSRHYLISVSQLYLKSTRHHFLRAPRLIAAADFGSLEAVKALIMNSADLEAQDKSRRERERPRGELDADSGMRQSTGL